MPDITSLLKVIVPWPTYCGLPMLSAVVFSNS